VTAEARIGTATDAVLAALVGGVALQAGATTALAPGVVAAGALVVVLAEAVAGRHADRVRRAWARPVVRVGALAVALATLWVGVTVAPRLARSLAVGGSGAYLLLVVGRWLGLFPPPERWPTARLGRGGDEE
jgi:MFS family permease